MELVIKDWQKVKDVGMPNVGDFCFVLCKFGTWRYGNPKGKSNRLEIMG